MILLFTTDLIRYSILSINCNGGTAVSSLFLNVLFTVIYHHFIDVPDGADVSHDSPQTKVSVNK